MTVQFASVDDVREFVSIATLQPFEISVVDGEHVVSAKSFMELFTMRFTRPLELQISDPQDAEKFARVANRFLIP